MKLVDFEAALSKALSGPMPQLRIRVDGSELLTKKRLLLVYEIEGKPVTVDEAEAFVARRLPGGAT